MYTPSYSVVSTNEALDFISANGFAILISNAEKKLWGTHIPLELSGDRTKLQGHISKANPQWKSFSDDDEVLAIFPGPHTYISASWYDHENVPTWNYIAVHVYGKIKIIEGEELFESLKNLIARYEQQSIHPVTMETMSPEYVRKAISGLIGIEIQITNVEAAYKLSQNRDHKNHSNIVTELQKRNDQDSLKIAEAMKIQSIKK